MDTDRTIDADTSRVSQLFDNLLRNAIKHRGEDVTVRVDWLADCPGFYIEDTGAGIPAEERARVFESGYTTTTESTGFGLAIVTEIVEAHGWEIDVTAGADGGARFEIRMEEGDGEQKCEQAYPDRGAWYSRRAEASRDHG